MIEAARPATADDVDVLVDLADQAIEELRPKRGGEVWFRTVARREPRAEGFRAQLDDAACHVVVGTIDDVIVGYGVLRVDELDDGGRLGTVTDLFVLPGARKVGIGEAMMNHLVDLATAAGCAGVDSVALPGDRDTKNFFETFGLVARSITVHRRLDDEDG